MIIRYRLYDYIRRQVWVDGRRVQLTRTQNTIFFMLYVNVGRPVSSYDITDALYGYLEDGGPYEPHKLISQMVFRINMKTGFDIYGDYRRNFILPERFYIREAA